METIRAIDIMNHPPEARRDLGQNPFQYQEFQIMLRTTFKSMARARQPGDEGGGERKQKSPAARMLMGHASVPELIADMDRLGYEYVVITATKMWSYHYHHTLILDYSIDDVGQIVAESNGRVIGAAGYNPFRIEESLKDVDKGVKEYGFKYVDLAALVLGREEETRPYREVD